MLHRRGLAAQICFWGIYGTAHFLAILPAIAADERIAMAIASAMRALTGFATTTALWPALRRAVASRSRNWLAGTVVIVLVIGLFVWPAFDRTMLNAVAEVADVAIPWIRFPRGIDLGYVLVLLGWSAGAAVLLLSSQERAAREAMLEERAAAHEAQARSLAARLNPHFFFNSLNAVRALVVEDAERARTMLTRLSEFLRHALAVDPARPATLGEEIASVLAFLRIEEVRFEPDLEVIIDADDEVRGVLVPPLFLQPLVENAVAHGEPIDGARRIRLTARAAGNAVRIEISNSGVLRSGGEGTGLELTKARLRQMYGEAQRVMLRQADSEVTATVEIDTPRRRVTAESNGS